MASPNPNDTPKDLDALDAEFDAGLPKAAEVTEDTKTEDTPADKDATEEEILDKDAPPANEETKDAADASKVDAKTDTASDDPDDEILKALSDAGTDKELSDDDIAKNVVDDFSKVAALAEKNKWESPELSRVLGYGKTIVEYAQNLSQVEAGLVKDRETFQRQATVLEAEFAELLTPIGLTKSVFQARNWPQLVVDAFKKTYNKVAEPVSALDTVEDDDDIPLTKAEVKQMFKKYQAESSTKTETPKEPTRSTEVDREREETTLKPIVESRIDYWVSKEPLLSALAKKSPALKEETLRQIRHEVGTNYAAALGKDRTGAVIKQVVDAYAKRAKTLLTSAGVGTKKVDKATPQPNSGGRPNPGVANEFKRPGIYKEVDGRKVKISSDDAMAELDSEFDKVFGVK